MVYVLVALGKVLGKVDACAEHASDVGVPLVEALLHDGVDKGGSVEERPLVRLTVILLRHSSAPRGDIVNAQTQLTMV